MKHLVHLTYTVESKHDLREIEELETLRFGSILGNNLERITVEGV